MYATLSLLYRKIGECSLAWKYYEVAKDPPAGRFGRATKPAQTLQGAEEREFKKEELHVLENRKILDDEKFDKGAPGTVLTLEFSFEQYDWPSHASCHSFRRTITIGN